MSRDQRTWTNDNLRDDLEADPPRILRIGSSTRPAIFLKYRITTMAPCRGRGQTIEKANPS